MEEIWKPIADYEGLYEISNYGRIKSLLYWHGTNERILKSMKDKNGYLYIVLYKDNINKKYKIHRLVLETFVGPCPSGMQCCHNDGKPDNDFVENLRWDTLKNNHKDKIKHGTYNRPPKFIGSELWNSKLNDNKIIEIRKMFKNGVRIKDICRLFNLSHGCISHVVHNRTWKHVKGKENE
jgi:hypothetical protein